MFTLAHELAHLWLGESALSDLRFDSASSHRVERWCNQAAAELLVPLEALREALTHKKPLEAVKELARQFKVSTLVILRRLLDAGHIPQDTFQEVYSQELVRLRSLMKSSGGNFYLTRERRASRRFVRALVISTLEGQTLYRDAFQMLGIRNERTLGEFGLRLGVTV
jgi:Zn-dependent peptidase ImmA (M78 family)